VLDVEQFPFTLLKDSKIMIFGDILFKRVKSGIILMLFSRELFG